MHCYIRYYSDEFIDWWIDFKILGEVGKGELRDSHFQRDIALIISVICAAVLLVLCGSLIWKKCRNPKAEGTATKVTHLFLSISLPYTLFNVLLYCTFLFTFTVLVEMHHIHVNSSASVYVSAHWCTNSHHHRKWCRWAWQCFCLQRRQQVCQMLCYAAFDSDNKYIPKSGKNIRRRE